MISASFPSLLQSFFTDRLLRQRQASPHTVATYRDCFRLLLQFAKERLGKMPSQLRIEDLDAPFIGLFLDHLEGTRKNSARTRNVRLGAIHSFFRYVASEEPAHALDCQRVLAVPNKRHEQRPIDFLNREEIDALLAAPNPSTWMGRRDRTFLLVAVQTGLRVSELIGLNCQDVVLGTGAHVRCFGKGRKQRCTPLRPETAKTLDAWLRERHGLPGDPLFPSIRGDRLSRDAVERRITKYTHLVRAKASSQTSLLPMSYWVPTGVRRNSFWKGSDLSGRKGALELPCTHPGCLPLSAKQSGLFLPCGSPKLQPRPKTGRFSVE
ncbi:MAG: integrase [Acidobacteria bacterium]|nr:MAG: integrase [Acidobacteriota bacterium]